MDHLASGRKLYSHPGTILYIKKVATNYYYYYYIFFFMEKAIGAKGTRLRLNGSEYES